MEVDIRNKQIEPDMLDFIVEKAFYLNLELTDLCDRYTGGMQACDCQINGSAKV